MNQIELNLSTSPFNNLDEECLYYPKLFLDYTSSNHESRKKATGTFFEYDYQDPVAVKKRINDISKITYNRKTLVEILLSQNHSFGASQTTLESIKKISLPDSVVIVTGQQVGLALGPLYTTYKVITAILLSKKLSKEYPENHFIPLFWLEGEDHDYREMATITTLHQNKLHVLPYKENSYQERAMVGRTKFSSNISDFVMLFLSTLPDSEYKEEISLLLKKSYKEGETFLSAFAKLLLKLFSSHGLAVISSDNKAFKSLCKDVFKSELTKEAETSRCLIEQTAILEDMGYNSQVKASEINIFYLSDEGKRLNIEKKDSKFRLRETGEMFNDYDFLDIVDNCPEKFSAKVVLRPILQDVVLPTLAYIGGPSEISYFAQLKSVYNLFGIRMPIIMPRLSSTIIEKKIDLKLSQMQDILSSKLGWNDDKSLNLLYRSEEDFTKQIVSLLSNLNIESFFKDIESNFSSILKKIETTIANENNEYLSFLNTTSNKITYHATSLKKKALQLENRRQEVIIKHIEKIYTNFLPLKKFQERSLNLFYYLARYGVNSFLNLLIKEHATHIPPSQHIFTKITTSTPANIIDNLNT